MKTPDPNSLRQRANDIESSARAIADGSEYPRVAAFSCREQVAALRNLANTLEDNGGGIPAKHSGMTGEQRRDRRAAILRLRSAQQRVRTADAQRRSHDIGSRIPFGQPILVGHHSERGHRNAIEKMRRASANAYEASKYADSLDSRADSVERSHAISASDSDAVEQYANKLRRLSHERDQMKKINAAWRKFERSKDPTELHQLGFDDHKIETLTLKIATAYSWEKAPFVGWQITNLGATIRETQKKLAAAEARQATPETTIESDNGIRLEDCPPDNRVRLFFPCKPNETTRTNLKRNGFRWAPSLGCWQAYRNRSSLDFAKGTLQP